MGIYIKNEIRKSIMEQRDALDIHVKEQWDHDIFHRLTNSELYKKSKVIFVFVSFRSEVDTHKLIKHGIKDQKMICVPKIISKKTGIEVFQINEFEDLEIGYYGILEPPRDALKVDRKAIDLILMPGLAFDLQGGRVGYGGGFYDRFLMGVPRDIPKIAIAYPFQVMDKVPVGEDDVKIDGIITNENIYYGF